MHINNPKKTETRSKDGIIYFLIFILYATILILIFINSIKFLKNVFSVALDTPAGEEITAKYGQLDLENYALLAYKLDLKKPITNNLETATQESPEQTNEAITRIEPTPEPTPEATPEPTPEATPEATPEVAPLLPETVIDYPIITPPEPTITATATPIESPILENTTTETALPETTQTKPKIIVTNSTLISGLAANLRNKLVSAGYEVIRIGNTKPTAPRTFIKIKPSFNLDSVYIAEIKKIVGNDYNYALESLDEGSYHDLEIIIGSK